jgi:RNA polymerase primary sigma factor
MKAIKISQSITNRDSDSLEKYLCEIGKEPLVSANEEVELADAIAKGNEQALNKLIKGNLRFVVSVAKQYQNQGLSLADLINEGNIGLIKAATKFDPSKGFKFISYAVWWIRQSILLALSDQSRLVRVPLNKINLGSKIKKAIAKLEQQIQREPTSDEIASLIDVEKADVDIVLRSTNRHISMDAPTNNGDETSSTIGEVLNIDNGEGADLKMVYSQSLIKEIQRHLSTLPLRHKEILCSIYGIGNAQELSMEEIAEKYGLSRERVRQIKDSALLKLKTHGNSKVLRSYL